MRKPESPHGQIFLGFLAAMAGGASLAAGIDEGSVPALFFGYVVLSLSSILVMVGVIAVGVRLGMRHIDFERHQRES